MVCKTMMATAPWPKELEDLCGRIRFRGWSFKLETGEYDDGLVTGTRMVVTTWGEKCGYTGKPRPVQFHFPVPATTFDRASWQRWLRDCKDRVRDHEDGEHLSFVYKRLGADGTTMEVAERPFAPLHGPGRDPHRSYEVGIPYSELRVAQDGSQYPGLWWDGGTVHDDKQHSACETDCVPVRLVNDA